MCYRMSSPEVTSLEERNKTLTRSFIEEIFNEHNLPSIEKYFGNDSVKSSPQAGKGEEEFLTDFFNAYPDWRANIEYIVAENNLVVLRQLIRFH